VNNDSEGEENKDLSENINTRRSDENNEDGLLVSNIALTVRNGFVAASANNAQAATAGTSVTEVGLCCIVFKLLVTVYLCN
jgi:hypothetical protein